MLLVYETRIVGSVWKRDGVYNEDIERLQINKTKLLQEKDVNSPYLRVIKNRACLCLYSWNLRNRSSMQS